MVGAVLPGLTTDGRPYGHDVFHPLWEEQYSEVKSRA